MRLSWVQPYTGGTAIVAYSLEFKQSDDETWTVLSGYCEGSQASVVTNKYCDVPFTTLRGAPLTLPFAKLIQVKIAAVNVIG